MVFSWLKAQDAVDAGAALADSFLSDATQELRGHKLGFYKRVRFANAFKWRLLEKGVAVETAHDITQTLLLNMSSMGAAAAVTAQPIAAPASPTSPVAKKSLQALFQQAGEAAAQGDFAKAVALYRQYTVSRPKDPAGYNGLGLALGNLGRYEEARRQFHLALRHDAKNVEAIFNTGNLFLAMNRFADAENFLRRAARLKPTDPLIRTQLSNALTHQSLLEKSRTELDKVLKTHPRFAPALTGMGVVEQSAGRFAEAEQMYRRALDIDAGQLGARIGLVGTRRMTAADSTWIADIEQLATQAHSVLDEARLRFALGKAFNDLSQYDKAFSHYKRANELLRPLAPVYDERAHSRFVNDMICVYSPEAIQSAQPDGSSSTRPVFVVGMPRSGTSLVEQMLASHPGVAGAGELEFWHDEIRADESRIRKELLPAEQRQKIAANYLEVLKSRHPDAHYVVDKTPSNADHLGLIYSVFPDARILYVRRDPIDTCLSCFFQNFSLSLNFKFDLRDLASYYRQHARLMAHWRKVLPAGTILDVPYEELVADQETWTRKILAHLGLEWDVACLKFNENPRPVVTASSWQVRQRLYGDSVKRWRHYSKFIGPLRELTAD